MINKYTKDIKTSSITSEVYTILDHIPKELFQDPLLKNKPYLSLNALKSLERNNLDILFSYIVFRDEITKALLGFFLISNIEVKLKPIQQDTKCKITQLIIKAINNYSRTKKFNTLVCGHPFINGEHGFAYTSTFGDKLKQIPNILKEISKTYKKKRPVHNILIKDFSNLNSPLAICFKKSNYHAIKTDPGMILHIDSTWTDIEAYMQSMKTKYRTKAKKAFKESSILSVEQPTAEKIEEQIDELSLLYKQVLEQSSFNLGHINLKNYAHYKQNIPDKFILKTYKLGTKIIGFMTAFINGDTLDAHYIGLDYKWNKQYYVYQRILYDYVVIAIDHKLSKINFGRSAGEIKSSIGALPKEHICYVRHHNLFVNMICGPIIRFIQPVKFRLIKPFKTSN